MSSARPQVESVPASNGSSPVLFEDDRYQVCVFGRHALPAELSAPQDDAQPEQLRLAERAFLAGHFNLPPARILMLDQVHGNQIVRVQDEHQTRDDRPLLGQGDGLITTEADRLLVVRTADCLPIFLWNKVGPAVAVIHAGRRGLVQGIAKQAARLMRDLGQGEPEVLLGPCISAANYEVGDQVVLEFPPRSRRLLDHRHCLDLSAEARIQLGRVVTDPPCTFEHNDAFFSHRRGDTGRNLNTIRIKTPET